MRRPLLKSHLVNSPAAKEMKEKINQMICLMSVESIFQVLKKKLGDFVLSGAIIRDSWYYPNLSH